MQLLGAGPATDSGRPIPGGVRGGAIAIAIGLVYDLAAHSAAAPAHGHAFPSEQHLAHLVVLVGMAMILAAIVLDGVRNQHRRQPEGRLHHAVR
jgi:hypothetical protein